MTTIRKVAQDADVSVATVALVLNNDPIVSQEVRSRVLASINNCGYVSGAEPSVARSLGLVYTGGLSLGRPYDAALCAGFGKAMDECGLDVVVLNSYSDKLAAESYTHFFHRRGVYGVLLRTTPQTHDVCGAIAAERYPAIVVGDRIEDTLVSYAYCDAGPSSREAIEHLVALGHRRIGLVMSNRIAETAVRDRLTAYEQTFAEHGLASDPQLVFRVAPRQSGVAELIHAITHMINPPTAIYVTDPFLAVGALIAAQQRGIRIPEDISLIGFDVTDIRQSTYPPMTAVCQDSMSLGWKVFSTLASMIGTNGTSSVVRLTLPTWLEINGTTARNVSNGMTYR